MRLTLSWRSLVGVFGIMAVAVAIEVSMAGQCCRTISPYASCSGCIQVMGVPPRFVQAGENSANKCRVTESPDKCDEVFEICFSMTSGSLYDENCQNVVGVGSVELNMPQCNGDDDWCGGG